MDSSSIVGFSNISLNDLTQNGGVEKWFDILKDGESIG